MILWQDIPRGLPVARGYGDLAPGREPGSRAVVAVNVLFGVPFFGMMLARIVEIAYGRAKKIGLPAVVGPDVKSEGWKDDLFPLPSSLYSFLATKDC